jgi:hypothetical protein
MYCHGDEHASANILPLTTWTEIAVVNGNAGTEQAAPAGQPYSQRLSARKQTNSIVGGQCTAKVTREWQVQGSEEEWIVWHAQEQVEELIELFSESVY